MAEVSLRTALPTDAGQVARVHRLSRADYYRESPAADDDREAMWAHLLADPDRSTHVAVSSGSAVGFMSVRRVNAAELELTALYVLPVEYDGGIGSRLHDVFDGERGRDCAGVLEVWMGNLRAIRFYTRRGWVPTGTTRPGPQEIDFETYWLSPSGEARPADRRQALR